MDFQQNEGQQKIATIEVLFQDKFQHFVMEEKGKSANLWNYQQLKKSILQRYQYNTMGKDKIHLILLNFYSQKKIDIQIPIFQHQNFTYLVTDMLQRNMKQIKVKVKVDVGAELKKKKQREKNLSIGIEWDSDGEIQYCDQNIKQAIQKNKPASKAYDRHLEAVRCFFCHKSSKDLEEIKFCGPFYGPFLKQFYAHLLCLLWCSYVYLNRKSDFCGIREAIGYSKNLKCSYCGQKGASFNCHSQRCEFKGHYKCALENNWLYQWQDYKTFCPSCIQANDSEVPTLTISQKRTQTQQKKQVLVKMQIQS